MQITHETIHAAQYFLALFLKSLGLVSGKMLRDKSVRGVSFRRREEDECARVSVRVEVFNQIVCTPLAGCLVDGEREKRGDG